MKKLLFCIVLILLTHVTIANDLDIKKIQSISYMISSPKGVGMSSFGHSYLLFKEGDYVSLFDSVIEFAAEVSPENLNYLRGLGIDPYDRQVALAKFSIVKKQVNFLENRDLIIYDLKLTSRQKETIITKINEILAQGKMGKYSFFSSNCADAVAEILNETGMKIEGLAHKIPTQLSAELVGKGYVSNTTTFPSKENFRLDLIKQHQSSLGKLTEIFQQSNSIEQLYYFLNLRQKQHEQNNQNDLTSFVNSYPATFSWYLKKQLHNLEAVDVDRIPVNLKSDQGYSLIQYKVQSSIISCHEIPCIIKIVLARDNEKKHFLNFTVPITALQIVNREIFYQNMLVGVTIPDQQNIIDEHTIIFGATPVVTLSQDQEGHFLSVGLIIDQKSYQNLKSNEPITNQNVVEPTNIYPQTPMCATFVYLQKDFLEQAIFAPQLPRISYDEYLNLLTSLLSGNIVVIPGFNNAYDFTKSFEKSDFIKTVYPFQQEHFQGLINGFDQWLKMKPLTQDNLITMDLITTHFGISIPVVFKKNNDNKQPIAHALLVTKINDEGDYYSFSGYDPNFTYTDKLGSFDKRTLQFKIKTYGVVDLYVSINSFASSLTNIQLINAQEIRKLLVKQSALSKQYIYTANQILNFE